MRYSVDKLKPQSKLRIPVTGPLGVPGARPGVAAAVGDDDVPVVAQRVGLVVGEESALLLDGLLMKKEGENHNCFSSSLWQGFKDEDLGNIPVWLAATVQRPALGRSSRLWVSFSVVPLAISFLPGSRVAVVSAHQPLELPRKLLTEPWD